MAGRTERIIVEIIAGENGTHQVNYEYQPATSEAGPGEQQAALELAINAMIDRAITMRLAQGQRIPAALAVTMEAKTFLDFY